MILKERDKKGPMKFNLFMQALTILVYAIVLNIAFAFGSHAFSLLIILSAALFVATNGLWGTKNMYAIRTEVGFVLVVGMICYLRSQFCRWDSAVENDQRSVFYVGVRFFEENIYSHITQ